MVWSVGDWSHHFGKKTCLSVLALDTANKHRQWRDSVGHLISLLKFKQPHVLNHNYTCLCAISVLRKVNQYERLLHWRPWTLYADRKIWNMSIVSWYHDLMNMWYVVLRGNSLWTNALRGFLIQRWIGYQETTVLVQGDFIGCKMARGTPVKLKVVSSSGGDGLGLDARWLGKPKGDWSLYTPQVLMD